MINSIFDNDLYKFTMQQAALYHYPDAKCKYKFKNRGDQRFDSRFIDKFSKELCKMFDLQAKTGELEFMSKLPFIKPWYLDYLSSFTFDPDAVKFGLTSDGNLDLEVSGKWHEQILWEVPLMALISECYFSLQDDWSMEGQLNKLQNKTNILAANSCRYADFGTRRRRSYEVQDLVVSTMKKYHWFAGTSNVHFAHKYGLKPIGTMAHEWVQAISGLESLNHANRFMMKKWTDLYEGSLGVALTDTYGLDSFLKEFNSVYAKLYDGVRHDSGDPIVFADRIVDHYKSLGIKPDSKSIVFSDGLNAESAAKIQKHCDNIGINCSFGIGTSFTNDFETKPLNMVIKLWEIDGFPVVKLSDNPGKANGEPDYVDAVRLIYGV